MEEYMPENFNKQTISAYQKKLQPFHDKAKAQESFTPQEVAQGQKLTVEYYAALKDMGITYGQMEQGFATDRALNLLIIFD